VVGKESSDTSLSATELLLLAVRNALERTLTAGVDKYFTDTLLAGLCTTGYRKHSAGCVAERHRNGPSDLIRSHGLAVP